MPKATLLGKGTSDQKGELVVLGFPAKNLLDQHIFDINQISWSIR